MSAAETGQMSAVETGQMSAVETGPMSAAESGQMSAVETGQVSAAETGQMSAVETRQMYSVKTGQRPVAIADICLVSTIDICPVSAADICPVSTKGILSQQQTSGGSGVILRETKMISTPFFNLKCAKWNSVGTRPAETGADRRRPAQSPDMVSSTPGRTLPTHAQRPGWRQFNKLPQTSF